MWWPDLEKTEGKKNRCPVGHERLFLVELWQELLKHFSVTELIGTSRNTVSAQIHVEGKSMLHAFNF